MRNGCLIGNLQRTRRTGDCLSTSALTKLGVASANLTVLRKDAAMGQDGHACMASAETSRNSFSVAPLAA